MARPPNPEAPTRLLEAARRVFAREGVDAARIQDIAAEAGFSKAAFYLYFESKEQVCEQLMAHLFLAITHVTNERHARFQDLLETLGRCTEADVACASPRFAAFLELDHEYNKRALVAMWEERDIFGWVIDAAGPRREIAQRFTEVARATLAERLDEVVKAGYLRADLDPDLCAEMMIGAWLQLARRMVRMTDPPDFEHWTTQIDRFTSEGLGCRPGIPLAKES